jgi:hypothetical protein
MAYAGSSTMTSMVNPSITQNEQRDVADTIRYKAGGNAPLCKIIAGLTLDSATGKLKRGEGLIRKESVKDMRYENYSTPARPIKFTVTSGTEVATDGVTLAAVTGLSLQQELHCPRNGLSFRVEDITTLTVKGASIGNTFSCAIGDELIAGPCPIAEGSAVSAPMNGTDDHSFNILEYVRSGVSMTDLAMLMKPLAGGDVFARRKRDMLNEFLQRIDVSMIHSKKSASSATQNYTSGHVSPFDSDKFFTTDGLVELAANSWDMENGFSLQALRHVLPLHMGDIYNENDEVMALISNDFYGKIQDAIDEKNASVSPVEKGEFDTYGVKTQKVRTDGVIINFIKHSAMNVKGAKNRMIIFQPKNVTFVTLEGCDMVARSEIQTKKTLGREDEIVTTFGLRTEDAGETITDVTNCFAVDGE